MTSLRVEAVESGIRLDAFVAGRNLGLTRSQAEKLSKAGKVRIGGQAAGPGRRVQAGEQVEVALPAFPGAAPLPEAIPVQVIYEDDDVLVINKPQGMVVHPGAGRQTGTLVNALLARFPSLSVGQPNRPGIVHRLDRDTSGLMVVARTEAAYRDLARQVRARELERRYLALVWGRVAEDRLIIEVPIGRHLHDPQRMAAVLRPGPSRRVRSALTEVRVQVRFGHITLVEARIATGRTHQIRVHLAHQGYPVVGDPVYGRRRARQERAALRAETLALVRRLPGQALHAHTVSFRHPMTGQTMAFSVPAPRPMAELIAHLRRRAAS